MSLLAPIGLAALAIPLLIYLVHWLFGTRRQLRVPALFLWLDLPNASTGRRKRHIPPWSWLLVLQLMAATLAAFALARPGVPSAPPRHVALIVDASATMQATDVNPSRFETARRMAEARLAELSPTDMVSLIRAGQTATLVASGTRDVVERDLNAIQPGQNRAAIREALALASTRISRTPDRTGQILLFTDGAWSPPASIGPLAAPVETVLTGGGAENQAISGLIVRMDPSGLAQTAFVELSNAADHVAHVPIQLNADGAPIDERQVDIPARGQARLSIPLPADAHNVVARLLSHDALPLDDQYETIAPGGPVRDVDVLGNASDGLRHAIESIPNVHINTSDQGQANLSVLAGVLPPRLPTGPLLLVDPPADSARLLGVGLGSALRIDTTNPLLQGLDLVALQDETPSVDGVPGWAHVVLGTRDGPLLMTGQLEGHPVVALTFDPSITGLEKSLAFPLLISNATSFLLSESSDPPVSAFDPSESDIRPRPVPAFDSASAAAPVNARTDLWPWLAALAMGVLGLEWVVFARRG